MSAAWQEPQHLTYPTSRAIRQDQHASPDRSPASHRSCHSLVERAATAIDRRLRELKIVRSVIQRGEDRRRELRVACPGTCDCAKNCVWVRQAAVDLLLLNGSPANQGRHWSSRMPARATTVSVCSPPETSLRRGISILWRFVIVAVWLLLATQAAVWVYGCLVERSGAAVARSISE